MTLEINFKYRKFRTLILIVSICIISACKKNSDPIENSPPPLPVDIHVSATNLENSMYTPYYIRNGETIALPYDGGIGAKANDIVVSGEDVYIVGVLIVGETTATSVHKPVIWKNGSLEELKISDATHSASTVALSVHGEDVYAAGLRTVRGKKSIATVWKNGVARNITDGSHEANLQDILVVGNDIYVTGFEKNDAGTPVAKYWKNGNPVVLSDGKYVSYTMSIDIDGSDVYVAGFAYEDGECNIKLWKNGVGTNLTAGAKVAMSTKILVNNDDVYVVGYEQTMDETQLFAVKNGNQIIDNFSKEGRSVGLGAARFQDHFFVIGGQTINGKGEGTLWQDGTPILLSKDKKGITPSGIFVTPKP